VSALPTGQSVSQWGARGQRVDQVVHGYCFVVSLAAMGFKHAYQTDGASRPATHCCDNHVIMHSPNGRRNISGAEEGDEARIKGVIYANASKC
jgi:thiamine pyrophosphokinase